MVASMSTRCCLSLSTLCLAELDGLEPLGPTVVADIVEVEQFLDLGEAQAHTLAPQDPRQPGAIAIGVEPLRSPPLGRDQRLILIEAKRARGDVEFVAQLADRIMRLVLKHARRSYFTFP